LFCELSTVGPFALFKPPHCCPPNCVRIWVELVSNMSGPRENKLFENIGCDSAVTCFSCKFSLTLLIFHLSLTDGRQMAFLCYLACGSCLLSRYSFFVFQFFNFWILVLIVHAGGRSQGPYGRFESLQCAQSRPFKYPQKGLIFSWAEFYRAQFLNFVVHISKSVFHPVYFNLFMILWT